jgi:hypothetical protein
LPWLWAIATALTVIDLSLQPVIGWDTDMWWHLAGGRWMVEHHAILMVDPFSHTAAGVYYNNRHWLFQLLLYGFYAVGGDNGPVVLRTLLIAAAALVLERTAALRRIAIGPRCLAVIWATWLATRYFHVRPNFVSLLCGALCLHLLERGGRWRWGVPAIMAVWTNCHGGVPTVMLYGVAAYAAQAWVSDRAGFERRTWLALLGASFLALFVSPSLLNGVSYVFELTLNARNPYVEMMSEFAPPDLLTWGALPTLSFMIACGTGAALLARRGRIVDALLLVGFMPLLLRAGRHLFLLLPMLAPTVAWSFDRVVGLGNRLRSFREGRAPLARGGKVGAAILCAALAMVMIREGVDSVRVGVPPRRLVRWETVPEGACAWMLAHGYHGRMFNDITWGGYLLWRLSPSCPVFIDARNDLVYRDFSLLDEYSAILEGRPEALSLLERRGIDIVVQRIGFDEGPLFAAELPASPRWRKVYDDGIAAVFARASLWDRPSLPMVGSWIDFWEEGNRLLDGGNFAGAIAAFERALALYPDCTRCRLGLGVALARSGRLDAARREWNLALLVNDRLLSVHGNLGYADQLEGRLWAAACEYLEELRLGDDATARARLAALPAWPPPTHLRELWLWAWRPLTAW